VVIICNISITCLIFFIQYCKMISVCGSNVGKRTFQLAIWEPFKMLKIVVGRGGFPLKKKPEPDFVLDPQWVTSCSLGTRTVQNTRMSVIPKNQWKSCLWSNGAKTVIFYIYLLHPRRHCRSLSATDPSPLPSTKHSTHVTLLWFA
jgi:hypothetical protein